ncbi:MAG: hypothetical protein ACXQTS_06015 [Candidatus Methanospirareceae archaeon]
MGMRIRLGQGRGRGIIGRMAENLIFGKKCLEAIIDVRGSINEIIRRIGKYPDEVGRYPDPDWYIENYILEPILKLGFMIEVCEYPTHKAIEISKDLIEAAHLLKAKDLEGVVRILEKTREKVV